MAAPLFVFQSMKPTDIQIIGEEMAIKWDNDEESFIRLAKLRKACPCAGCKGEMDVMTSISPLQPAHGQALRSLARRMNDSSSLSHLMAISSPMIWMSVGFMD